VYSSVTATHAIISPILEQFRRQHPHIDIKLHTGDQADAIERIVGGTNDLAIAARVEELPDSVVFSALQYSPLQFICPVVSSSVTQVLADVDTIDGASDWDNLPLVIAERGLAKARLRRWLLDSNIEPVIYAQVAGHEAIVSMVALGLGVGVVPQLVIDNSPFRDKVRVISMVPALKDFEVGICARHRRLESPLVQAFWNVAKASYPDNF
jgi:LysR family positive regulator for ilvC